MQAQQNQNQR